mgnify:CR=1 FL=1
MPLILTYTARTPIPIELDGVTPDRLAAFAHTEIQKLTVFEGNRKVALGELFTISGDATDQQLIIQGDLSGVHWIGAGMRAGHLRVEGPAGRHLGSGLAGGVIEVSGSVQGWAGAEMRRGLIRISGNAGNCAGGALPGSIRGMTGGTLLIHGNCGDEAGLCMRRGLIAIAGSVGECAGRNLIAGTLVATGACARRAGAGMRRGTLVLAGGCTAELLPGFSFSGQLQLTVMRLLERRLQSLQFPLAGASLNRCQAVWRGDLASKGLGEILLPVDSIA